MRKVLKYVGITAVIFFALIGLLFTAVFVGMRFELFNVRGSSIERNNFFASILPAGADKKPGAPDYSCTSGEKVCQWNETREWAVVAGGLQKDAAVIARVSAETGVPAELIAAVVVPEQVRFFTAEREVFKRYFEPLKLLGSLSQFSLGVSGIKQETARKVEQYASDPASMYYPGDGYAKLIAYTTTGDHDAELYKRLTNADDHYYSYLYTALFIKEIQAGWRAAGYPIDSRPEITATLFNIGFENSTPKADPRVGGAPITVGGKTYSFGTLAGLAYASGELHKLLSR